MEKAKVYFCREITPENVVKLYDVLNKELKGNIAIKLHSGEKGNKNFLRPEFLKPVIDYVGGTVVECNTAYEGARNTTAKHKELIKAHGWDKYFKFDLLDEEGYISIPVNDGIILKDNYVGKNITKYDSMLVLSHFKGHAMGGYGGALKQLSIGVASSEGKSWIHSAGKTLDQRALWKMLPEQDRFLESMADAAKSVVDYFKGNMAFINIMKNLSVDCDCDGGAQAPCMADIGILSSLDPVAVDKACLDLVYNSNDRGRDHLIERIESRHGIHTLECAYELGVGNKEYELIEIK